MANLEKMTVPRRISIPGVLIYAVILTALLYQLNFQSAPDAPLRHFGVPPRSIEGMRTQLAASDQEFIAVADGQNALLHLLFPATEVAANADVLAERYYSGVYAMYPRRIFVGWDNHVINNGQDMVAADQLPTLPWLREHHVGGICTLRGDAFWKRRSD